MAATRREFLCTGLGMAALPFLSRLSFATALGATPRPERILILIELEGGNDGLNTVVPFAQDGYHRARSTLRLEKSDLLLLQDEIGLRRELEPLKALFDRGQLAIVQGVGYPQPDRSHFRSADIWHTASLTPETTKTGWIGRLSEVAEFARRDQAMRTPALMVGGAKVPLLLVGERGVAPQVEDLGTFRLPVGPADGGEQARDAAMQGLARAPGPGNLGFLRDMVRTTQQSAAQLQAAAARYQSTVAYPDHALAVQLKLAAQLIGGGLDCSCYFLRHPGYDTHSFQAESHALLLTELGASLGAFCQDLAALGAADRVCIVVTSEFGRRVMENGSRGTDHGAAAPVFVAGAGVKGGLVNAHPSLEARDLDGKDKDADVRFTTDFRRLYATLLDDWFEIPSASVLGGTFEKLPLFA